MKAVQADLLSLVTWQFACYECDGDVVACFDQG